MWYIGCDGFHLLLFHLNLRLKFYFMFQFLIPRKSQWPGPCMILWLKMKVNWASKKGITLILLVRLVVLLKWLHLKINVNVFSGIPSALFTSFPPPPNFFHTHTPTLCSCLDPDCSSNRKCLSNRTVVEVNWTDRLKDVKLMG